MAVALAAPSAGAEQAEPAPKPGKLINAGDVLSGELNAMKVRGGKKGKRVATYQLTSEPRRLPPPNGLCNLETGSGNIPAHHHQRCAGRAAEGFHRQGNLGQGRRSRLRAGRGADERSRGHEVERGDEALRTRSTTTKTVVARLDRATQYSRDAGYKLERPRRTGSPGQAGVMTASLDPHRPQFVEMPAPLQPGQQDQAGHRDQRRRSRRTAAIPSPSPHSPRPTKDRCGRPRRAR